MTASELFDWATSIAMGLLLTGLLLSVVRLVKGPSFADRVLALDLMTSLALSLVAVFALRSGFSLYVDIAIAIALAGFLATIALARYLMLRGKAGAAAEEMQR